MALRTYQILDLGLTLESEDADFLSDFHMDYARFQTLAPLTGTPLAIRFEPAGPGTAFMEIDGVRRDLQEHASAPKYALFHLHRVLMDTVRDFTVLHGAVLAVGDRALAISGPSGTGKTTLTLDLLEAGLAFLSDDFCPVSRSTGWVHPYPGSLWVRDETGAGAVAPLPEEGLHRGKRHASPGAFEVCERPCPLAWFVCLAPGEEESEMDVLRVRLRDPGMEAFLEDARALGDVSRDPGPIANLWEVRYPKRAGVAPRLSALLDKHREAVVMSSRPPSPGPDFRREPRLEPIPSHEAAFILLRERKQHLEALGADKVKAGAFLVHLNEILAGVACFRLTPGFRATRKELVLAAVGKGEPR